MSTRGFEFAYMLDGSNATPVIRDFPVSGTGGYEVGDAVTVTGTSGNVSKISGSVGEVLGVMQERRDGGGTAGADMKVAIATRNQVWRCSTDASTVTGTIAVTKTQDVVDHNTIDADDVSNGSLAIVDNTETDDEGNIIIYAVFNDTTFGNA